MSNFMSLYPVIFIKTCHIDSGAIEISINYAHFMLLIMNATHNQRVMWIVLATIMIGNGFNELAMGLQRLLIGQREDNYRI